jgi:hypothetical protein
LLLHLRRLLLQMPIHMQLWRLLLQMPILMLMQLQLPMLLWTLSRWVNAVS